MTCVTTDGHAWSSAHEIDLFKDRPPSCSANKAVIIYRLLGVTFHDKYATLIVANEYREAPHSVCDEREGGLDSVEHTRVRLTK